MSDRDEFTAPEDDEQRPPQHARISIDAEIPMGVVSFAVVAWGLLQIARMVYVLDDIWIDWIMKVWR